MASFCRIIDLAVLCYAYVYVILCVIALSLGKNSFSAHIANSLRSLFHKKSHKRIVSMYIWSLSRYSSTGVLKKELAKGWPCEISSLRKGLVIIRRAASAMTSLTESEAEARCIRAWRKSCEVLKNQEAEFNENDRHQEIMSRSEGVLTTLFFYTFSVAERTVRRISHRDKGAKAS